MILRSTARALALAGAAVTVALGASASDTSMHVERATTSSSVVYEAVDKQVINLNIPGWQQNSNALILANASWMLDLTPSGIASGSTLTSVVVAVDYRMGNANWAGTAYLEVYDGATYLGRYPAAGSLTNSADVVTIDPLWDLTTLVNARPDPIAALDALTVKMANDGNMGMYWTYCVVNVSYTATTYVPPNAPSIASPTSGATGVARQAPITSSGFSDDDAGDTHAASDWEVHEDASGSPGALVASLTGTTTSLTSATASSPGGFTLAGSLAGANRLAPSTLYHVRVRYRDDHNLWSAWSAYSDFTTAANTAPATPSIAAPVNNATGVSRNPTIVASAFSDPDTDAHASSDWEIFSDSAGTMRVASALTETTYLASIAVTTANFTFEGALSGESSLARSVLYWVGVTYRDQYGAVSARSTLNRFQTSDNSPPNTPMVYAVFDTTGDPTRRPWITASGFSDPDALDTHASSLWEVFSGASLASRVAWSLDAAVDKTAVDFSTDAVTYEGGLVGKSALLPNTNYWVIVTYVDDKGGVATSASRQFMTLGNAAPAEVNVATVTSSRTPTATAGAYYDDEDDAHLLSDWEVREGTLATGALVATSSDDQTNLTSIAVSGATMTFRGSLAGLDSLAPAAWYNVRVRYRDEFGDAVAWDSVAVKTFQTPANQVPVTPAIVSPAADRVGVSRSPTVSGSAFSDPDFDLHQSTDWEIYADDGSGSGAAGAPAALVATSMADASHKTIVDVDPAMFAFTGALAGKTSLEPGTWYWVRVTYRDSRGGTSANSSASAFETGLNEAPEIPYISSPAGGAVDVELEPALAGSTYFDPDFDAHASTDWELFADAEGLTRLASRLADATNLTGIAFDLLTPEGVLVGQTHLAPSTTYYARVTYRDVHSAETQGAIQAFTTGAYPTTDTWPFYGSGCRPGAPSTGVMLAFVALCALAYAIARPRHSS